jgi:hypothetical protein
MNYLAWKLGWKGLTKSMPAVTHTDFSQGGTMKEIPKARREKTSSGRWISS